MTTAFDIVAAINARRKEKNWSIYKLSRKIDVHRVTLTKYLSGATGMRLDTACEALHKMGLDLQIVVQNEEEKP